MQEKQRKTLQGLLGEALNDEEVIEKVKNTIMDTLLEKLSWSFIHDFTKEFCGELVDRIKQDEEFQMEIEKIKAEMILKITRAIKTGLMETINKIEIKISDWQVADALRKGIDIQIESD